MKRDRIFIQRISPMAALLAAAMILVIWTSAAAAQTNAKLSVPHTHLQLGGWAAPHAQVLVVSADNNSVAAATVADKHGRFELTLHGLKPDIMNYEVTSINLDGAVTPNVKTSVSLAPHKTTHRELILPSAMVEPSGGLPYTKEPLSSVYGIAIWQFGAFAISIAALGLTAGSLRMALMRRKFSR